MESRIVEQYLENRNESFTGSQIIRLLKCDFKTGYKYLKKLNSLQILTKNKVGKSYTYSLTAKYHPIVAQAEYERYQKSLKQSEVASVAIALKRVTSPMFIALLFGSRAKRTNKPTSDVDVCIIADEGVQKEIVLELDLLPLKLHLLTFTPDEFMQMLSVKKENVAHEILKNHCIFHGIDSFYWTVNNA
jgi:predicted nucleotidyltransferase